MRLEREPLIASSPRRVDAPGRGDARLPRNAWSGRVTPPRAQRGFTLVVGLLMLALVTLVVVAGFNLGSSNLKVVNNMQVRDEAVSAANLAAEQVISSNFTQALTTQVAQTVCVNVDGNTQGQNCNGTADYSVTVAVPCWAKLAQASQAAPSDVELGTTMSASASWNTDWEIRATVTDSNTGASAVVVNGVRRRLTQADKDSAVTSATACP